MKTTEVLREVFRITERRNGATYRTKRIGYKWVPLDSPEGKGHTVDDFIYAAPSTSFEGPTIRTVYEP